MNAAADTPIAGNCVVHVNEFQKVDHMLKTLSTAAVALGLGAAAASSAPINISYQSAGVFGAGNLQQTIRVHTPGAGYDGRVRAGLFHLTGDSGLGDFVAFCVDLAQFLNNPQQATLAPNLFGSAVQDGMARLFDVALGGDTLAGAIDTSLEAAGLQVALWEVLYDTGGTYDLGAGGFHVSENAAVRAQAEAYIAGMATAQTSRYVMTFLESEDHQDLVTVQPVPLPATGLMLAFGLIGAGATLRRRNPS